MNHVHEARQGKKPTSTVKQSKPHWRLLAFLALIWLLLDQAAKQLAVTHLADVPPKEIIPDFFSLVLVHNRGAAFGFLNDPNIDWQFWLFLIATIVGCGLILYLMRSLPPSRLLTVGLAGIMGGALGNLIDRVRFRAVVDFLDFYYGDWHWPAFNVADIGICVGAGLVLIIMWKSQPGTPLSRENTSRAKDGGKK